RQAPGPEDRQATAQGDDLAPGPALGRIRPGFVLPVKVEENRHNLFDVAPVAGIVGLDEEPSTCRQAAMDQYQESRRDQSPRDLTRIVKRLGVIAMDLVDAAGGNVFIEKSKGVNGGEA